MPMKKSVKAKWIAALRSGKYKQADSQLKAGKAFCCLGVLADIHGCAWKKSKAHGVVGPIPFLGSKALSPTGGHLNDGEFGLSKRTQLVLARKNDSGYTFEEIANHIARYL